MSTVTREELISLLLPVRGVGAKTAEAVADAFGSDLARLAELTEQQLTEVDGIGVSTARALRRRFRVIAGRGDSAQVEALEHDEKRTNIPTDQLSQLMGEDDEAVALYPRNPELDPQLVWQGKDAQDAVDLAVPVVPIYIQDKVVPQAIIENLRDTAEADAQEPELSLFDDFDGLHEDAVLDFYQHEANWSNRLILGDALVAMTSLAEKENLKGMVQTIYLDPPYGIKFQSNWQVSTTNRSVTDGRDITRQPEQVRAFRDTWKNGVHTYLSYLRDRLQVAHTLLADTGSVFVQIGEENLHLVRSLLDEVFGPQNAVSVIAYVTTSGFNARTLPRQVNYLLWYARDADKVKYRQIWKEVQRGPDDPTYRWVHLPDGTMRGMTREEAHGLAPLPEGSRRAASDNLVSSGGAREPQPFEFDGEVFLPGGTGRNHHWKANYPAGMERLRAARRIYRARNSLRFIRYADDFPFEKLTSLWPDTATGSFTEDKIYVVQTSSKVVERCVLMTSDPGDLVLDPTCGSGTTAYVAEKWGRRWITIDTSRVALALARARIMGSRYPYWLLADTPEGAKAEGFELGRDPVSPEGGYGGELSKGFVYKRALHVMLSTIANCEEIVPGMSYDEAAAAIRRSADSEVLYDQPHEDTSKVRVAGPFTVEYLSPHRTIDPTMTVSEGERAGPVSSNGDAPPASTEDFGATVIENLDRAGVQNGYRNERLEFDSLEPYADGGWVAATGTFKDAEGTQRLVAVSIGPEHGTVGREQVNAAAREAVRIGAEILLVCGFAFDGGATDEAADATAREFPVVGERKVGRVRVLNVRINADLMMDEELKATGSGNLFMVFGEPDVEVADAPDGQVTVTLKGVDVYDPVNNEVRSSGPEDAMAWFIDTDYDENQFFVRHAYFTGDAAQYDPYAQLKRALNAEINLEAWSRLHSTTSLPFRRPSTGKIAVKVINHYGDEVLKVFAVGSAS